LSLPALLHLCALASALAGCGGPDVESARRRTISGTCLDPGAVCLDCEAQEATGGGYSSVQIGYRWTGRGCVRVGGSWCDGKDCDHLYPKQQICLERHASCPGLCDPQTVNARGTGDGELGYYWNGRGCVRLVGSYCMGSDCEAIFSDQATCARFHTGCGACEPHRVQAEGEGDENLGYFWDGKACTRLTGSHCLGEDCGAAYPTGNDCRAVHGSCPRD
jgi:hypothetical protein